MKFKKQIGYYFSVVPRNIVHEIQEMNIIFLQFLEIIFVVFCGIKDSNKTIIWLRTNIRIGLQSLLLSFAIREKENFMWTYSFAIMYRDLLS